MPQLSISINRYSHSQEAPGERRRGGGRRRRAEEPEHEGSRLTASEGLTLPHKGRSEAVSTGLPGREKKGLMMRP